MGKTFKDSVYSMAKASAKKTKTPRRAKLQPYDRKTFIREKSSKVTQNKKTIITPSPEVYGRDLYY